MVFVRLLGAKSEFGGQTPIATGLQHIMNYSPYEQIFASEKEVSG